MARRKKATEQSILLPWERRGSFWRRAGLNRVRPFVVVIATMLVMILFGVRERRLAGIRSTRATLFTAHQAVEAYLADHEQRCPESMAALTREGYLGEEAVDAWGRPLRLVCPGRESLDGYDLMSDGPDGVPGGLDRIE